MGYFSLKKGKKPVEVATKPAEPVLNEEDEAFLARITSQTEGTPPPLPDRPLPQDLPVAGESSNANNAQVALMNGAQDIPLPDVPDTPDEPAKAIEGETYTDKKGKGKEKNNKSRWSFLQRRSSKSATADDLHAAASGLNATSANVPANEAAKEKDEMTQVLDQLDLAAVNNRVFSISDESKDLMRKFTLVLKDLVNGVPTAYKDLESLLTNSEDQLNKTYKQMPSFMQSLISKLPNTFSEKFTESIGPEVLATAAAKHGLESVYLNKGAEAAGKMGMKVKVPSLKELVTKQGAIASLLRAIMNFLRTRFPAVLGLNVLWSMAVFILLLVFWYCHKRGREVRLENERKLTEAEMEAIKAKVEADGPGEYHPETTTTVAPEGASIEEVREGMLLVQAARQDGEGESTDYAEGGSLAQAMKEDEKKQAEEEAEKERTKIATQEGESKAKEASAAANAS